MNVSALLRPILALFLAAWWITPLHADGSFDPIDANAKLDLKKGDRIVIMGDAFAERAALHGYFETMFHVRFPELQLTFRNLGYSADTPAVHVADITKGDGETNREANRALNFGTMTKHLTDARADVIFLCFGMTDSFKGLAGLHDFNTSLRALIKIHQGNKYNGKGPPRLVLVGPIAHEKMGGEFPDPSEHNKSLKVYSEAMRKIAVDEKLPFADLFLPTFMLMNEPGKEKLTINGIHLNEYGNWAAACLLLDNFHPWKIQDIRLDAKGKKKVDFTASVQPGDIGPFFSPSPPPGSKVHRSLISKLPKVVITGLPSGDEFTLELNGFSTMTASSNEWGRGIGKDINPLDGIGEGLRLAVVYRNQQFFHRWRAVNGEYIYGRRARPFGVENFPGEMKQLDDICREWDGRIEEFTRESSLKSLKLHEGVGTTGFMRSMITRTHPVPIEKVYNQKRGFIGGKEVATAMDTEEARKAFKLQDGFEINLFASEKDFPLHNPLAMAWDTKGRLWVTTMPTYPHLIPGVPPDDKILILEDTKGTGKADKCTVFADGLYLPTGLEFGNGGVYVGGQPNMLFLKDTNGDDVADMREPILHGFGTGDSHHALHAFVWSPEGALHFHEGIFHRTNCETPWGPVRQRDAGIYRFQPRSHKLETYVSYNFANPWGHVFDRWGFNFIADASGGANYNALPITGHIDFPGQHPGMKIFTSIVRPTCGCELVSSRHFPPESQGNFLVNNNIGFQGIKQHQIIEEGSGFTSKEIEPLLFSTDRNFRPVDIKFGPDGALYIVDWYNPLIGHMQHSIRDPGRDHYHGRIWRITAKGRPLIQPAKIAGAPIPKLLDLLKEYEDRTRYRVRMELRERKGLEVATALKKWIADLPEDDPNHEHHLLEALWVYQGINVTDPDLLRRLLRAKDYHARAGATRALRHWRDRIPEVLDLFEEQVNDVHPRVRLEAVVALSFFKDARAADIALQALKHPTDYYLDYGLKETMSTLQPYWKPYLAAGKPFAVGNPAGANYLLGTVSAAELIKMPRTGPVYFALLARDGILSQYRQEALEGLAKIHKTDYLSELFNAIERVDKGGHGHSDMVLHDLAHLLTGRAPKELAPLKPRLENLARAGRMPLTRQVAYVALVAADGRFEPTWTQASQALTSLRDLVDAVPIIPDPKLRQEAYPRIKELLHGVPEALKPNAKSSKGTLGRFVRIELPGEQRTLTLAEVQIFENGVNVGRQGKARQSSTSHAGDAQRALDGNTSGIYADGGLTHSKDNDKNPWWEVDLGGERAIESIVIWNRTEGGLGKRLDGFKLTILDSGRHEVFARDNIPAPAVSARFTFDNDPAGVMRLAAMNAITTIPGFEEEVFAALAKFYRDGVERDAAVRALRRIPRNKWPSAEVRPLAEAIVANVAKVPAKERTEIGVLDALQLGNDLATLLPPAQAKAVRAQLGDLGVQVVLVRTIPHLMAFDRQKIYVEAGKPAVIILENSDIMPHNLLIGLPGSLLEIGLAAEKMANDAGAFAKGFVPNNPKVLHSTRMLQPRETDRLQFVAPMAPGEFVFVCTFPGHWRVMNGILHVVPKLADVPAHELNPPTQTIAAGRPFVRNWTVNELAAELPHIEKGRSFAAGKELFKIGACIQCHKMQGEGSMIGPDLTELAKKIAAGKMSKVDLLTELIEPSKKIEDKYKVYTIVTGKGALFSGIVLYEDKKIVRLISGPLDKPREIALDDIDEKMPSNVSLMPTGLLVTFTREEILDLLAYLAAGGDARHPAFARKE